jgi:hypothetical protein
MADSDKSINNLRYNQITQGLEGFGGGSPMWTPLVLAADGGAPGGSNTQVQFNDSGTFGGSAALTFNKTTGTLTGTTTIGAWILPIMTDTQRNALTPTAGMMIYSSTTNQFEGYNGTAWVVLG